MLPTLLADGALTFHAIRIEHVPRRWRERNGSVTIEPTVIRGFSEAMLDGTIDDREGVERSARIISDESNRVLRLVQELLTFAGDVDIDAHPTDVRLLLDEVRHRLLDSHQLGDTRFRTALVGPVTEFGLLRLRSLRRGRGRNRSEWRAMPDSPTWPARHTGGNGYGIGNHNIQLQRLERR